MGCVKSKDGKFGEDKGNRTAKQTVVTRRSQWGPGGDNKKSREHSQANITPIVEKRDEKKKNQDQAVGEAVENLVEVKNPAVPNANPAVEDEKF